MRKTILLVDDEDHMLRLLKFALKDTEADVQVVRGGREAIDWLQKNTADVILMDYSMPGMDGVAALREIRHTTGGATPRVLMLTARDQTGIRQEAAGLEVEAFLTKPFSPSRLSKMVQELLDAE